MPPSSLEKRVGDKHRAAGSNPDIIRAVHEFAVIICDEDGHRFIRRDGPKLVVFVGAGDEIAFRVEMHSVGVTGWLHERGELAVHAPLHDAVVVLVNEKNVARLVARRSFGEQKIAGEFLERGAGRDDALSGDGGNDSQQCGQ